MSEQKQQLGSNFVEHPSGLLLPSVALAEKKVVTPSKAEIDGYSRVNPVNNSYENYEDRAAGQLQKDKDEAAFKEILDPKNVIELKQKIETAVNKSVGTSSKNINMGLDISKDKTKIRNDLIEQYLMTGDKDRAITPEVRTKLEELLRLSFNNLENRISSSSEVMHGPKTKEEAARDAILDPANVAKLQAELDENAPASSNASYDWSKDPEWNIPDEDAPANRGDEVTLIAPVVRGVSGDNIPTVVGNMPQDPAERQSWVRRHRRKLLGGVALLAAVGVGFVGGWFAHGNNKDNQRSGSVEKIEQPAKQNPSGTSRDNFMKRFKVNEAFPHPDNQTGPGFEKGDSTKQASEQLKKNFDHHPTLLAEAVYAYQHGIGVDEARAHVDEINKMAKSFTNGDYLSTEGQKWATKLGKSIDNGSSRWVTRNEMINGIWYNSGIEENGNFDKFFINPNAGFNANKILRVTLGNGKVIYLKGNCENFLWKDTIESTPTSQGPVRFTPTTINEQTIPITPPSPKTGLTPKGPDFGSQDNSHQYGNNGEIHGNDAPEVHQNPGAGNNTNTDTTPPPSRDTSGADQVPGAGGPSGNTTDPGQPK